MDERRFSETLSPLESKDPEAECEKVKENPKASNVHTLDKSQKIPDGKEATMKKMKMNKIVVMIVPNGSLKIS